MDNVQILNQMKRVYCWQRDNRTRYVIRSTGKKRFLKATDWERGVFWLSVADAWQATGDDEYLQGLLDFSLNTGFRPGPLPRFADDHVCIQAYLPLYSHFDIPEALEYGKSALDIMLTEPKPGREDWWWCDSLFMAPPVFAGFSSLTGDRKYIDYMDKAWWDAVDSLYDPETGLYFRDKRYIPVGDGNELREANGEKVFWSRGIGWVLAAIPRILAFMPADYPSRPQYLAMFSALAEQVVKYQQQDGFWRTSLLDPESFPSPESSATSLFCYGLAWGIQQGHLDRDVYLPVVENAWSALESCIHDNGMLGWVQLPAYNPRDVKFEHNIDYGVGAFLLAATAMLSLSDSQ
ncbi:glycoside hydrolase family 105 protein [Photobacterium aphoticum]|uniref:Glycosyl hydrolase family 88 n=1 Tax=Photobacterium aphoticum TaxID=754436 RepID=A0A0J1GG82_9GAMM|nr:glycoside hydrolase family 88 protein [Photobacterium aphoticum]KLU98595.1 glycosyl hydrolase family 88 [Photobacterium aphoticum]PSU57512.1 glycosyl hydrolase family 88 [Photobacterium aphoticum]GHA62503.1 glycosyl hydrolase family 88 [Photobacterium aphoticum]